MASTPPCLFFLLMLSNDVAATGIAFFQLDGETTLREPESCNPVCRWSCDNPTCEEVCAPQCQPPQCETRCKAFDTSGCTDKCEKPKCTVQCPNNKCSKTSCTGCSTSCSKPVCRLDCPHSQPCESVCADPVCEWQCKRPDTCPTPRCTMKCDVPKPCADAKVKGLKPAADGERVITSFSADVPPTAELYTTARTIVVEAEESKTAETIVEAEENKTAEFGSRTTEKKEKNAKPGPLIHPKSPELVPFGENTTKEGAAFWKFGPHGANPMLLSTSVEEQQKLRSLEQKIHSISTAIDQKVQQTAVAKLHPQPLKGEARLRGS